MADNPVQATTADGAVSIDAWAEEAKREIDRFVAEWKRDAESQPEMFPLTYPDMGEWDEQYRCATGG